MTWDELYAEYLKEIDAKVAAETMNCDLMTRLGVQLKISEVSRDESKRFRAIANRLRKELDQLQAEIARLRTREEFAHSSEARSQSRDTHQNAMTTSSDPWYARMAAEHTAWAKERYPSIQVRLANRPPVEVRLWKGSGGFYAGLPSSVDPDQCMHTSGAAADIDDAVREAQDLYGTANIARYVYIYRDPSEPVLA